VSTGIEYSCQITLVFTSPNARVIFILFYLFLFGTKLEVIYLIIQIPLALGRYGGYYRFRDTKGLNTRYCWENTNQFYCCNDHRKGDRKGERKGRAMRRGKAG
jgi:hypothetical protein